jgi:hypothetical protein
VSINVNDQMMYDRWEVFSREIDNEVAMVSEMTKLCSNLESGQISQNNEDDYMQNNDVDTGNERTPPYAK